MKTIQWKCRVIVDEFGNYKCPDHGEFLSLGAVKSILKFIYGFNWKNEHNKLISKTHSIKSKKL